MHVYLDFERKLFQVQCLSPVVVRCFEIVELLKLVSVHFEKLDPNWVALRRRDEHRIFAVLVHLERKIDEPTVHRQGTFQVQLVVEIADLQRAVNGNES